MSRPGAEGAGLGGALPRNHLRLCLLLALAEGPAHGYELLEQVGTLGLDRADPGGLYRALRAMDEEGLLRSWWEPSLTGPARRTYALTDEGLDWLHLSTASVREVARLLDRFLERCEALTARIGPPAP